MRKVILVIVWTLLLVCAMEGCASIYLATRQLGTGGMMDEVKHCEYDADLGWMNRPNVRLENVYEKDTTYTTNAQRFRAKKEFTPEIPDGKFRIICLGDSYTMGYGVDDENTYPAQLEKMDPRLETINMGLGGFGPDQDWLWYKRDGVKFKTNVLLFAFVFLDFHRLAYAKYNGHYPKPKLEIKDGKLDVTNVPVPQSWSGVTFWRRMRSFSETVAIGKLTNEVTAGEPGLKPWMTTLDWQKQVASLIFDDLNRISKKRGQTFVVAYLPVENQLPREPSTEARWAAEFCRARGIPFLDLARDFARMPIGQVKQLFRRDWHFTTLGNRVVAGGLLRGLRMVVPGMPK